MTRVAQCSCGQLEATVEGEPLRISMCHYEMEGVPDVIAIPVGVFADPTFPAPRVSVYEERKHAWVSVPEDAERYD
jgi:hypothetical protein